MCGRYVFTRGEIAEFAERFGVQEPLPELEDNYNVSPTQSMPVVVHGEAGRRVQLMRWGLTPKWRKEGGRELNLFNARCETVSAKPAFRHLLPAHRALVPACGFYEWRGEGRRKQPYYFGLKDEDTFAFAGLYDVDEDGVGAYTILTTVANDVVAPVHARMPLILRREHEDLWLDPDLADPHELEALYVPYPTERLGRRAVSAAVNSSRSRGPELIAAIG